MFNHLEIPIERMETKAARASLSKSFGFSDDDQIQDWERHFEDFDRIAEFVKHYESVSLDHDERFLLMELILASSTNCDPDFLSSSLWRSIKQKLGDNPTIHGWSIWNWACIDDDLRLPYNDFIIAPDLQLLLLSLTNRVEKSQAAITALDENTVIQFGQFWLRYFNGSQPDAHKLRHSLKDRWVRFHSFAGSKRYVENKAEGHDISYRTALFAQEILGKNTPCWFVANRYNNAPELENDVTNIFKMTPSFLWYDFDQPLEPGELVAYVTRRNWDVDVFKSVLYHLATGEDAHLMWISETDQTVFSAYDGGMDLILPNRAKANELIARYPDLILPNLSAIR